MSLSIRNRDSSEIRFLSLFPSNNSRLGDIGFTDEQGSWQRILNVLETDSCHSCGLSPLTLSHARQHYITQARYGNSFEPYVKIPDGWEWEVLDHTALQRYVVS
jgi:hypothetical protein